MPCDRRPLSPEQTLAQRLEQARRALKRLEQQLLGGQVKVIVGPNGAVAFGGWKDRDGISDVCAYRVLSAEGSWALKQAAQKAEALSGRRINASAVAAGHHSHDDGKTWGKH